MATSGEHPPPPTRSTFVDEVENVVRAQLAPYGTAAASIATVWGPRAGMWFVEVKPAAQGAAAVSIGLDSSPAGPEGDELVVSLPHTYWEIWSGRPVLEVLASDLEAIFTGRIEEAGRGSHRFAHLLWSDGQIHSVGKAHLPVPWRWRHRSTYSSYGAAGGGH